MAWFPVPSTCSRVRNIRNRIVGVIVPLAFPLLSPAALVFTDDFSASTLNSLSPALPAPNSAAYHLFSSKSWNPAPSVAASHLRFGIAPTTSGHIEAQARFTPSPIALTNTGDYLELKVTFVNTSGLFALSGHLGFGLYNSGGVPPIAGGMNATAVTGTTGITGGAQGWRGYVARLTYNGGSHTVATRPAQSSTTANNQDLITEGSGSQSYTGGVNLASSPSTLAVPENSTLTEMLRITRSTATTLQIESRLYLGADTNGALLASQSASAAGANLLTNSFDSLAVGWRAMANTLSTAIDVQSITVSSSFPDPPSDTVAGLYFQQQPANNPAGVPLTPPVIVVATNSSGVPVTNAAITMTLGNGDGSLSGTTTQITGNNGAASFADLVFTSPGAKQLLAVSGDASALSATFNISGTPPLPVALWPANNSADICPDTLLRITFDQPIKLQKTGKVWIYDAASPGVPVDTIDLTANVDHTPGGVAFNTATNVQGRIIGGETFTNYPVIVTGKTATIFPHAGVMNTNAAYYVLLDPGIFTGTNGIAFPGISATTGWRFSTKSFVPANSTNLVVAADGSADFCTVQGAVDYIPAGNTTPRLIHIRDGSYTEIVNINNRNNLTFRGQNRSNAVIAYPNNSAMFGSTHYRMVFKVNAHGIAIDNLTITNSTPRGGSQAEALMIETDKKGFLAHNVNLCSYQDTILMNTSGTQCYFQDSLIQGETDFIWGGGNAFFTNCEIRSLFGGYLTQPRTAASSNGMSFVKCRLTRSGATTATLGRSLGNTNGNVAFIDCLIDSHITGWTDPQPRYWEFGNSNLAGTASVAYNGTKLAAGSPELASARSAVLWLNGWSPSLTPNILAHPTNQAVLTGNSTVFSVTATGIPTPSYQWRKNGIDIPGETNATYLIPGVTATNAGTYSVLVSNPAGSLPSSNAILNVTLPQARAFPGAEGAGANTTGGRGGDVYYVTTLADSGAGSFRTGISSAPASGRTICFKVSGNILLNSTLTINKPNITVAGQTAPGDGICLQNYSFNIAANNLIVRHVRTRLGTNALQEADAMWINAGTNIVVDHLSASWSVDETLSSSTDVAHLTVQNCFITESLQNSIHVKGAHGYGGLVSSAATTTYSYFRNLYAHHDSRNPRLGSDSQAGTLRLDFRNNVIYNWGMRAGYSGDTTENSELNYVNNYLIAGPSSTSSSAFLGGGVTTRIFQSGNVIDTDKDGRVDGTATGWAMFTGSYTATNAAFAVPDVTTETAATTYQRVVALSGALPWRRDAYDQRIARTVRLQYGSLVDFVGSPAQATEYITNSGYIGVRGWPALATASAPADADSDGMPDFWELSLGLNPAVAGDRNQTNIFTGYTRLEEYLNWLAEPHALCDRNGVAELDLRSATGGATNLVYSVAGSTNGTTVLLADGYTARFTASQGTNGLAGFAFTATDPATGGSFGPVPFHILITTTNAPIVNTPPTLPAIPDRTLMAGQTLTFTCSATDTDAPPQAISYALQNAPQGATLGATTGVFYWRPAVNQSPTLSLIDVVAADSGIPPMSATQRFSVSVLRPVEPSVSPLALPLTSFGLKIMGDSGPDYMIQASSNLVEWADLATLQSPQMPFDWIDTNSSNHPHRFYRVWLGP